MPSKISRNIFNLLIFLSRFSPYKPCLSDFVSVKAAWLPVAENVSFQPARSNFFLIAETR